MKEVTIVSGDITTLDVDAVVNAANERMLGGGGVDGAIHRAAGPGLVEECREVPEVTPGVRCPTGESRITGGHDLPARHVIHTVGPVWYGGQRGEPDQLASCYRTSLELAAENGLRSIAFPAISCGVYHFPVQYAATIAVTTIAEFLQNETSVEDVRLVAFGDEVREALEEVLANSSGTTENAS